MRGKDGVYDTTRLLRRSPFGEWVTIYYDPAKVSTEDLLKWIKANRCPRAAWISSEGDSAILNPFIASGDTVQIRLTATKDALLDSVSLPKGFQLVGDGKVSRGENLLSVQIAKDARAGDYEVALAAEESVEFKGRVSVVQQIGKH